LIISKLVCSLAGKTLRIHLTPGSRAYACYGRPTAEEKYYCNFGLNPEYRGKIIEGGLFPSGSDEDGELRIFELPANNFFLATLFVRSRVPPPSVPTR
jgi:CTP synthase (UTP-ammonia lyase)